jgi:uncharacterized protein
MNGKIVIDGYNLMHASDTYEPLMTDLEAARDAFLGEMLEFCARDERQVEVVFDAGATESPETREHLSGRLTVVFTARGKSADSYIERMAYRVKDCSGILVVTGDYEQQRVLAGRGVLRMSPREFLEEMKISKETWLREWDRKPAAGRKKGLANRIPSEVKAALERLRNRL